MREPEEIWKLLSINFVGITMFMCIPVMLSMINRPTGVEWKLEFNKLRKGYFLMKGMNETTDRKSVV